MSFSLIDLHQLGKCQIPLQRPSEGGLDSVSSQQTLGLEGWTSGQVCEEDVLQMKDKGEEWGTHSHGVSRHLRGRQTSQAFEGPQLPMK